VLVIPGRVAQLHPLMASYLPERAKQCMARAFFMLVVIVTIAPSAVLASCGHDVTSSKSRLTRDSLALSALLKGSGVVANDSAPSGQRGEPGCSSPSCSRRRDLERVPSPSVPVRNDHWCSTSGSLPLTRPGFARGLPGEPPSRPLRFAPSLERPPRLGPSRLVVLTHVPG
jgi:hypothetical protein